MRTEPFPLRVKEACTFLERLRGLLGTRTTDLPFDALLLRSCTSIHTWGMRYALDLAFLDYHDCVVSTQRAVAPYRFCVGPATTASVLERPLASSAWLKPGDVLHDFASFTASPPTTLSLTTKEGTI